MSRRQQELQASKHITNNTLTITGEKFSMNSQKIERDAVSPYCRPILLDEDVKEKADGDNKEDGKSGK